MNESLDTNSGANGTDTDNSGNIAVIAKDSHDRLLLTGMLEKAGYNAGFYTNGENLKQNSCEHRAMIVCQRRSHDSIQPGLPTCTDGQRVVVLSDCTAESSIVSALEQGAHHYFNIAEPQIVLQARLEAALRQHSLQARRVLDVEPFKFSLERRCVFRDGKLINLSPKEYEFAYYLFANRHRVVVNSELMTSVWSLPSSMDARRIDTAACRVRKKMQLSESTNGWSLRRIRRVGYELLWRGEVQAADVHQINSHPADSNPVNGSKTPELCANDEATPLTKQPIVEIA